VSVTLVLILLAVFFLAYSNGANDNFKGVATLEGSGTCGYRSALTWAAATTLAGSLLALWLAQGLIATFTGKGLVPNGVTTQPAFLLAVSAGGCAHGYPGHLNRIARGGYVLGRRPHSERG
jgi:inorganic phosphate transporter, PiT family